MDVVRDRGIDARAGRLRLGVNCHHKPLSEYDPERDDVLFFGYVDGVFPELGYFTLSELEAIRGQFGLPLERDRFFTPCQLSEIR